VKKDKRLRKKFIRTALAARLEEKEVLSGEEVEAIVKETKA